MKNTAYIFLLIMFFSNPSFAQEPKVSLFNATIIAGFNASQIDGDSRAGYHKVGLNVGAKAGILLSPRWETGFEILFSQQGAQDPFIKGQPRYFKCHLNYISVPVLIHFKDWTVVNEQNQSYQRFWFGAGISLNRLMGGSVEDNGLVDRDLFGMTNPFYKNHITLLGDVNFYFTRNWGVNLRYERAPMNIRKQKLYNPHMIVFRALFTF